MTLQGEAKKEYQRLWVDRRRQAWLDANGPCVHCGSTEDLEVDHVDRATKSMNPTSIWSRREEVRKEELAKCQVLCSLCHKKKTIEETSKSECLKGHSLADAYRRSDGRFMQCRTCRRQSENERRPARRAAARAKKAEDKSPEPSTFSEQSTR